MDRCGRYWRIEEGRVDERGGEDLRDAQMQRKRRDGRGIQVERAFGRRGVQGLFTEISVRYQIHVTGWIVLSCPVLSCGVR